MSKDESKTLSDTIWDKISSVELDLFALPQQTLEKHAKRFKVTDNEVHLKIKTSAVLPALEEAVAKLKVNGKKLTVEQNKQFTVVALDQDS